VLDAQDADGADRRGNRQSDEEAADKQGCVHVLQGTERVLQ
jgi:hypothetical protein